MNSFKDLGDGSFRVAPGRYAVVAQDWTASMPDPRPDAERGADIWPADRTWPCATEYGDMEMLVLPVATDRAGATGRSIAIGTSTLVVFDRMAIVAIEDAQRRSYRYAGHIDEVAVLTVEVEGTVTLEEDGYRLDGFGDVDTIDTKTPGAFTIDGEMFDMAHPETADAFGYGSDAFNEALDEHGFPCDVKALRDRLSAKGGVEAVCLLNKLPKTDFAIAYYAPVQP